MTSAPYVWFVGGNRRYSFLPVPQDGGGYRVTFAGITGVYAITLFEPGKEPLPVRWHGMEQSQLQPGDVIHISTQREAA